MVPPASLRQASAHIAPAAIMARTGNRHPTRSGSTGGTPGRLRASGGAVRCGRSPSPGLGTPAPNPTPVRATGAARRPDAASGPAGATRSNSLGVSGTNRPATCTSRAAGSMVRPSNSSTCRGRRRRAVAALGPAQDGPDPDGELPRRERLHDVVVGSEFEPDDTVDLLGAGRQEDDRSVALFTDAAQDRQTVDTGEHQVEHDQVGPVELEPREGCVAVVGFVDLESVEREVARHDFSHHRLVVDDEHGARWLPRGPRRRA